MTTAEFLSSLRERGVRLSVEDGRLKCDAPPGVLDDGLRAQLAARKQELLSPDRRSRDDSQRTALSGAPETDR